MVKRRSKFWTVLKTKQAHSRDAIANVKNQAFEYFHPTFRMRAVRGVRKVAPLFPYYLMVQVNTLVQDWRVLASTKGVSCILMDGECPGHVSDVVVAEFRRLTEDTEDGYYHDPAHEHPTFTPGESVVGLRGLFAEKYGIYRGLAGNSSARVKVLFSILGKEAEFELRADDLQAVSSLAA